MDCFGTQLKSLADLLKVQDSDSDEDQPKSSMARMGPGDLGPKKTSNSDAQNDEKKPKNSKDIWDEDEVIDGAEFDDASDPRPQPEYEIVYRQAVTSEDIYLQMGMKNAGTASCEDMIVKIKLPDTQLANINVDVKDTFIDCRTEKYKLGLFLPHPVDGKNAKAQWDGKQEKLTVTMRMNRPYDFVNF